MNNVDCPSRGFPTVSSSREVNHFTSKKPRHVAEYLADVLKD